MQSVKTDQAADAQADLSFCWSHKSNCRFRCVLAQMILDVLQGEKTNTHIVVHQLCPPEVNIIKRTFLSNEWVLINISELTECTKPVQLP